MTASYMYIIFEEEINTFCPKQLLVNLKQINVKFVLAGSCIPWIMYQYKVRTSLYVVGQRSATGQQRAAWQAGTPDGYTLR